MYNEAIEDYLKSIYEIQQEQGKVATTVLAKRLNVQPASVTGMVKKLSDMNLLTYEPYQGVQLTQPGKKIALEVIRHHRLVELFLAEALGVPWDKVHQEAEKWEHVLSEELEERIDALLGYPTHDPHGAPIPNRNGEVAERPTLLLADLLPSQAAVIVEVNDQDPELLRYLGSLGLYPNAEIVLIEVAPFEGPLKIEIQNSEVILGDKVARQIFVRRI
ncbi:MAG: metal-dependent transcriptional regulator [Calditrichaceae bacterium]|nr:metal-dependent transcriptional regulator [Calditrichia bacterium]NUQ40798.1 metal-dependent transcriptional regulator [Calditrichaceae bacterium]